MTANITVEIPIERWSKELRGIVDCLGAPANDCTDIPANIQKLKEVTKEVEQFALLNGNS